jgi:hypothetical protein
VIILQITQYGLATFSAQLCIADACLMYPWQNIDALAFAEARTYSQVSNSRFMPDFVAMK